MRDEIKTSRNIMHNSLIALKTMNMLSLSSLFIFVSTEYSFPNQKQCVEISKSQSSLLKNTVSEYDKRKIRFFEIANDSKLDKESKNIMAFLAYVMQIESKTEINNSLDKESKSQIESMPNIIIYKYLAQNDRSNLKKISEYINNGFFSCGQMRGSRLVDMISYDIVTDNVLTLNINKSKMEYLRNSATISENYLLEYKNQITKSDDKAIEKEIRYWSDHGIKCQKNSTNRECYLQIIESIRSGIPHNIESEVKLLLCSVSVVDDGTARFASICEN